MGGLKESLVLAWVQNFWLGFGFGIAGKYLSNHIQTRRLSSLNRTVMLVDKTTTTRQKLAEIDQFQTNQRKQQQSF